MSEGRFPAPAHGGQLRQIAASYGISAEELLDFSANINPAGPPPAVLGAIRLALADSATLTSYPDLELTELKQVIADCAGVQPANISVANGFVPLLEAALQSLPIKRCLLPVPSFSEYRRTLENANVAVMPYCLDSENGFSYERNALSNALLDGNCDAILLANPQNPSGAVCEADRMLRLMDMAERRSITVLLDEAFIDYCPNQSLMQWAIEQPKQIVFRSVTKFFAVPGLRVAYAISHFSTTEKLNRSIAPWPVTSFAADAVCAALRDEGYAEESRNTNELRRTWLERELARLQITTYPSSANFLLLRLPTEVDAGLLWERMLVEQQIVLRSCANFEGLAGGHLRVAVRSESENERLITSLKQVLKSW
jgi:threonine-phosphate decarboxylase